MTDTKVKDLKQTLPSMSRMQSVPLNSTRTRAAHIGNALWRQPSSRPARVRGERLDELRGWGRLEAGKGPEAISDALST